MGLKHTNLHPRHQPRYDIEQQQVERYFKDLVNELYDDRGRKTPTMNVVLFLAADAKSDEKQEKEINAHVRFFKGSYKVIRGLNQIKGASSMTTPDESE